MKEIFVFRMSESNSVTIMITRDEKSHELIEGEVKLSVTMHPEQQRLIQIFVASLAMNPSDLHEIATKADDHFRGEKIDQ